MFSFERLCVMKEFLTTRTQFDLHIFLNYLQITAMPGYLAYCLKTVSNTNLCDITIYLYFRYFKYFSSILGSVCTWSSLCKKMDNISV